MTDYPAVIYIKASRTYFSGAELDQYQDSMDEPDKKKFKSETENKPIMKYESLKDMLENLNNQVTKKLESIEKRVDLLTWNYDSLEQKLDILSSAISTQQTAVRTTVVPYSVFAEAGATPAVPISSRVTFITLNREEDYPNGSWLGNPENTECRVRCHISPTEMFHLQTTCTTAEKMALTLLDYLFDRETQACSNISGLGKHKKKQLDPLFIYGIKCHLHYHFGIDDQDWNKIKQNVDSKCRTAFRRKMKGLPLIPKGAHQVPQGEVQQSTMFLDQNSLLGGNLSDQEMDPPLPLSFAGIGAENEANILEQAIKEEKGEFEILHATPEEVAEIQETHQIQLFSDSVQHSSIE